MRWPRIRMRLWMLIVLVAVVAIGIGAYALRWRKWRFQIEAELHRLHEQRFRTSLEYARSDIERDEEILSDRPTINWGEEVKAEVRKHLKSTRAWSQSLPRAIEYHAHLRQKYERAARRPWMSIALDPPEPELSN